MGEGGREEGGGRGINSHIRSIIFMYIRSLTIKEFRRVLL